MSQPYTYGVWIVKPGREDDFVAAWREMAEWRAAHAPGVGAAQLLQDEDQPLRFISVGPWDDKDALAASRSKLGFQERIARLREMLETYTSASLELRAEVAAAPLSATPSASAHHVDSRHGRI